MFDASGYRHVTLPSCFAPRLGLAPGQAFEFLQGGLTLLLGAAQVDAGPCPDDERLPPDVREFMAAFSPRTVFVNNAARILAGIRAGT